MNNIKFEFSRFKSSVKNPKAKLENFSSGLKLIPNDKNIHELYDKRREYLINIEKNVNVRKSYISLILVYEEYGLIDLAKGVAQLYLDIYKKDVYISKKMLELQNKSNLNYLTNIINNVDIKISNKKILFITFEDYPNYGLDTLYWGLYKLLGSNKIYEYPRKSSYHGEAPKTLLNYPCYFSFNNDNILNHKSDVYNLVKSGFFDCIIYCYHKNNKNKKTLIELSSLTHLAAGLTVNVPIFIIDQEDNFDIDYDLLNTVNTKYYFKREMFKNVKYDSRVVPLNFSYIDDNILKDVIPLKERSFDIFWAGKSYYTRSIYINKANNIYNNTIQPNILTTKEYSKWLSQTKIGINLFGWGFDTVRYYEIPAHGCLQLSEKPPIHILNEFVDGESIVYFEGLTDFENKLKYYLNNIEEAENIAKNGYKYLKEFHNSINKGKYVLSLLERL